MGVSSTSTTASAALQQECRQGALELPVAAPTPLPAVMLPITSSWWNGTFRSAKLVAVPELRSTR